MAGLVVSKFPTVVIIYHETVVQVFYGNSIDYFMDESIRLNGQ
ncbi:MAG TPA: hypothetical protein PKM20_07895 [Nitrosomonas sp.]|nr:hypothetical protein [Nitrosomonas sp.]HNP26648.1 hypothetical protein [Nitrosomonas sp.]